MPVVAWADRRRVSGARPPAAPPAGPEQGGQGEAGEGGEEQGRGEGLAVVRAGEGGGEFWPPVGRRGGRGNRDVSGVDGAASAVLGTFVEARPEARLGAHVVAVDLFPPGSEGGDGIGAPLRRRPAEPIKYVRPEHDELRPARPVGRIEPDPHLPRRLFPDRDRDAWADADHGRPSLGGLVAEPDRWKAEARVT